MLRTQKLPAHPRCQCTTPRAAAPSVIGHRLLSQPLAQQPARQPTILLIADAELFPRLANFLGRQTYAIYAALDVFSAQALLKVLPVDLVLFHCPPASSAWQDYHQLRRETAKPVLWLPTITAAYFVPTHEPVQDEARQRELANYRQLIELFCFPPARPA